MRISDWSSDVCSSDLCPSPEVEWCRAALTLGAARALVVNAGNANAFTGNRGRAAVEAIAARAAAHLGCKPSDVFVASTGVIGDEHVGGDRKSKRLKSSH